MLLKVRYVLHNSRALSLLLIVVMTLLAWAYLLAMTKDMQGRMDMSQMGLGMGIFNYIGEANVSPPIIGRHNHNTVGNHSSVGQKQPTSTFGMPTLDATWSFSDFTMVLVMWVMMMVAMMLPTAAPMIVTYGDILGNQPEGEPVIIPLSAFVSGYLISWVAYSIVAVIIQWFLLQSDLISVMMVGTHPLLNGAILVLAGLYQWSRLKDVCLTHCRTPLQFFLTSWRSGNVGALEMGIKHGAYCVGCCWALMILMLFFGLMNLVWIAGLSVIMLAEKILPKGDVFAKVVGVVFILWGLLLISLNLYQ